jgi:hypothetical protein
MVRPRWKPEVGRACFCLSGTFKTYDNLWEGEKEIPSHVSLVPEPKHA